jgi:VIT1/CCC1 family predicted Fe2+/Mn2+ transporter
MHTHFERHRTARAGWLRAGVLGADDGILSTASLMLGVVASGASRTAVLTAGVAGLTAGALAMAIGEYVSVGSQADAEAADRRREVMELATQPASELNELIAIYRRRGLDPDLARQVAEALTRADPLASHLRDELGHTEALLGHPVQAAFASASSFAVGAAVPLLAALFFGASLRAPAIAAAALVALLALGVAGAAVGGAPMRRGAFRVASGGVLAMIVTYGIGHLVGSSIG